MVNELGPLEALDAVKLDAPLLLLTNVFEHAAIGVGVLNNDLRLVWSNDALSEVYGQPAHQTSGKEISELIGKSAWTDREPLLHRALSGHETVDIVLGLPETSTVERPECFKTSFYPLRAEDKVVGVLLTVKYDSCRHAQESDRLRQASFDREQSEKNFAKQKQTLEVAMMGGKLGSWFYDFATERMVEASDICKSHFGLPPEGDFSYSSFVSYIHPEDVDHVVGNFTARREDGQDFEAEYRCIWPDGSVHWVSEFVHPIVDDAGKSVSLIGVTQDVTDRKQSENEKLELLGKIREFAVLQSAFLRDVLASVTDGKLRLCEEVAQLPPRGHAFGDEIELTAVAGLSELRRCTKRACVEMGYTDVRWQDIVTAVSEAGMNAIVHADGGVGQVYLCSNGCVQIWIRDFGKGINLENLPRATLEKGYTTKGTMGHGMKLMLQTADRVWLMTGRAGTIVVLEQDREPTKREWI